MKLIIDVEKDYYEMLKYNVEHGQEYKPFEIIANGIPYEEGPQGDLISRKALKRDICNYLASFMNGDVIGNIVKIIDNAPTVEYTFEEAFQKTVCDNKLYCPSRPRGEWICKEEYDDYPNKKVCECSECGRVICISHNNFPNFCENCGADMRKDGVDCMDEDTEQASIPYT